MPWSRVLVTSWSASMPSERSAGILPLPSAGWNSARRPGARRHPAAAGGGGRGGAGGRGRPGRARTAVEGLSELGYKTLVAHDAQDALNLLGRTDRVDILFSDVVMPGGMNGAQLAVQARQLRPDIRVLLTSGYTAAALGSEHGLASDLPVLSKPYRREHLARKLRLMLGGE